MNKMFIKKLSITALFGITLLVGMPVKSSYDLNCFLIPAAASFLTIKIINGLYDIRNSKTNNGNKNNIFIKKYAHVFNYGLFTAIGVAGWYGGEWCIKNAGTLLT